ncbi:MAG: ABC transporter ATP-binding protein [Bryobacteraceae bacterium]
MQHAIRFEHVTKSFIHHARRLLLRDRVVQWMRRKKAERFEALKDVSFNVLRGESVGLIGPNGAGKSTLLNLATGLTLPDSGEIEVSGRVGALLELGAGFHPDLTGAENIRINGALMGLSRRQVDRRLEEIVDFSGVREFIREPLRTYSSGMILRLAFSVAVNSDPDILLTDEILGVGDQQFFGRCLEKIREFQHRGKTILFASHSTDLITKFCQRAVWLQRGRVIAFGKSAEVLKAYHASAGGAPVSSSSRR